MIPFFLHQDSYLVNIINNPSCHWHSEFIFSLSFVFQLIYDLGRRVICIPVDYIIAIIGDVPVQRLPLTIRAEWPGVQTGEIFMVLAIAVLHMVDTNIIVNTRVAGVCFAWHRNLHPFTAVTKLTIDPFKYVHVRGGGRVYMVLR